jgi:hypothetical protein
MILPASLRTNFSPSTRQRKKFLPREFRGAKGWGFTLVSHHVDLDFWQDSSFSANLLNADSAAMGESYSSLSQRFFISSRIRLMARRHTGVLPALS